MPTSLDPQPADDEIECGNCGAPVYIGLSRCPQCGINLYEPGDTPAPPERPTTSAPRPASELAVRIEAFFRRLLRRPYKVDTLFGASIQQAGRFNDLVTRLGGDRAAAERLVEHERRLLPTGVRLQWINNAIRRWDRDNRTP